MGLFFVYFWSNLLFPLKADLKKSSNNEWLDLLWLCLSSVTAANFVGQSLKVWPASVLVVSSSVRNLKSGLWEGGSVISSCVHCLTCFQGFFLTVLPIIFMVKTSWLLELHRHHWEWNWLFKGLGILQGSCSFRSHLMSHPKTVQTKTSSALCLNVKLAHPLLKLKGFSSFKEFCLGTEDLHDTQSHASNQYLWKVYLEVRCCFEVFF